MYLLGEYGLINDVCREFFNLGLEEVYATVANESLAENWSKVRVK